MLPYVPFTNVPFLLIFLQLTNEFKFSIAALHHAHETYLVPELLKKAYGGPPAVALFATNARYKREAYRGSEFAPAILSDYGLKVVMKVRFPVDFIVRLTVPDI